MLPKVACPSIGAEKRANGYSFLEKMLESHLGSRSARHSGRTRPGRRLCVFHRHQLEFSQLSMAMAAHAAHIRAGVSYSKRPRCRKSEARDVGADWIPTSDLLNPLSSK